MNAYKILEQLEKTYISQGLSSFAIVIDGDECDMINEGNHARTAFYLAVFMSQDDILFQTLNTAVEAAKLVKLTQATN
jgi:hypothetical protein